MRVTSPHSSAVLQPTSDQVRAALEAAGRADLDDSPFVVLEDVSDFCQGFIQAMHTANGWWVEVRLSDGTRHFRSPGPVPEGRAGDLFVEFLQSGIGVLDRYTWDDVTESVRRASEYWARQGRETG